MNLSDQERAILSQFDRLIVSYSGGKDSTATLLWALSTGLPTRVIYADTGNEPPDTPAYLDYIQATLGITIEAYHRPSHSFTEIVRRRGMWPIPRRCLVSRTVKIDDFAWYLNHSHTPPSALVLIGQRREESATRSRLPHFSPTSKLYRPVYRPILDWTTPQVFSYLQQHGIAPHPAYHHGRRRIGCVWCVHSTPYDLSIDDQLYPERCDQLRQLRAAIGLPSPPRVHQLTFLDPRP